MAWFNFDIDIVNSRLIISHVRPYRLELGQSETLQPTEREAGRPRRIQHLLTKNGLTEVDWTKMEGSDRSTYIHEQSTSAILMTVPSKHSESKVKLRLQYEVVDLAGKAIENRNQMFGTMAHINSKQNRLFFSPGAQCLVLSTMQYDMPTFRLFGMRPTVFRNLSDFEKYYRSRVPQIESVEQGEWGGHQWAKISVVSLAGTHSFISAIEISDQIYLTDYRPAIPIASVFKDCHAYNRTALSNIENLADQLNE